MKSRIADAAGRSGRPPENIQLVAVTKTVGAVEARALHDLGVRDFGENRVQEALRKMEALKDLDARWHMIGHVQSNKANKVVGAFHLVHSLDGIHLAQVMDESAGRRGASVNALIEVNVSGEETKGGFSPDELERAIEEIAGMKNLHVLGLMTMAPIADDPENVRPFFARLRELRDAHATNIPANVELRHLSMGMTQDFEVAIEEGADIVRIGAALFREE